jgi:hypothetical protein
MASGTRYISALDVNEPSVTWSSSANAIDNENDDYADSTNIGDGCWGGFNMQDATPGVTALSEFTVKHMDINSEQSDDTYTLDVYNPDTTNWETL